MDIGTLENERRRAIQAQGDLRISGGWNIAKGGSPNTPTPGWDKGWPPPGTKPRPEDRPNVPTKLAHHTGDRHFTEPTPDQLIPMLLNDPTLNESDFERILGPEYESIIRQYLNQQQVLNNEMLIATHDKPLWRTPPAPGSGAANADNIADDLLIRTMRGIILPSSPKNPLG